MIEDVPVEQFVGTTYRYIHENREREILREMGLDVEGMQEMAAAASVVDGPAALNAILDSAFVTNERLEVKQTRFSDGTIRVFYSALEHQTAASEAVDQYIKIAVSGASGTRELFYMLAACQFAGMVKDLRPHHAAMPFLTQKDDQAATAKCNDVAKEAIASNLDGLLSPSAARTGGTCLPVFQRHALTRLEYQRLEKFTVDPFAGDFTVVPV